MLCHISSASSVDLPKTPPNCAGLNSGWGAVCASVVIRCVSIPVSSLWPISAKAMGLNCGTVAAPFTFGIGNRYDFLYCAGTSLSARQQLVMRRSVSFSSGGLCFSSA